ncbi:MAG: SDR family NAD(P)-dependent oxidoreductase [Dehalococcoidia bacterium]
MPGRAEGKVAVVVGAGQTPGATIGNGRATAMVLAREGAKVIVADLRLDSAQDTVDMIRAEGNEATAVEVDVTKEEMVEKMIAFAVATYGGIDILHNNVGGSLSLGDAPATEMSVEAWDRVFNINLRGMWLACKHAMPYLRDSGRGSIVNISSMAAVHEYPRVGYKTTKAAVIALTEHLASTNAKYNVRANSIMPGKINTPMAIEPRVAQGVPREQVVAQRDKMIPLGGKMGEAWDVAYAALFLHSDEAKFISGIHLPVDGGEALMGGAG